MYMYSTHVQIDLYMSTIQFKECVYVYNSKNVCMCVCIHACNVCVFVCMCVCVYMHVMCVCAMFFQGLQGGKFPP